MLSVYSVTNSLTDPVPPNNDYPDNSLPWAIEQANNSDGHDTIRIMDSSSTLFEREGGLYAKFDLEASLPTITEGVTIETQSGNKAVIKDKNICSNFWALEIDMTIDDTSDSDGDPADSDSVTLKDLQFANFGYSGTYSDIFAVAVNETYQNDGLLDSLTVDECSVDAPLRSNSSGLSLPGSGIGISSSVNASTITISDSHFYQTKIGIRNYGNADTLTISGSKFSSSPPSSSEYDPYSYAVWCQGQDDEQGQTLIYGNTFVDLWGTAILVDGDSQVNGNQQQVNIYQNYIGVDSTGTAGPNLGAGIIGRDWSGIVEQVGNALDFSSRIEDNQIINNGISTSDPENDRGGVDLDDVSIVLIYENDITDNAGSGLALASSESIMIMENDIVSNGFFGITATSSSDTPVINNRIGTNADLALSVQVGEETKDLTNEYGAIRISSFVANTPNLSVSDNKLGYDTDDGAGTGAGIYVGPTSSSQNLFSNNTFVANTSLTDENRAIVLSTSGSQGNLGYPAVSFTFDAIGRDATHWDIPVTLDAGSTYEDFDFRLEYYAYSRDEATGEVKCRFLASSPSVNDAADQVSDGIFNFSGTDAVAVADLELGEDIRVLAVCTTSSPDYLYSNTTAFSHTLTMSTTVVDEHVFYNGSPWGTTIDETKEALYPGEAASGENITSYVDGINGVMIDVVAFTGNVNDIGVDDFIFKENGSGSFAQLGAAKLPTVSTPVEVQIDTTGDGIADTTAHRITFTFPNDADIKNRWLEITAKDTTSGGDIGLDVPHVFYFGNLSGDIAGGAGSQSDLSVGSADLDLVRAFWGQAVTGVNSWQFGDANSDEEVSSADLDIIRGNWGATLAGFTAPARAMASASLSTSATPSWTAEADKVYERYGLLDDDPTNDVAIDAKFWDDLYDALGLTFAA